MAAARTAASSGLCENRSPLLRRYDRRPPRDRVGRLVPARVGRRRAAPVGQSRDRRRVRSTGGMRPPQRERAVAIADEGVELARAVGLQPRRLVVGTGVNWQSILLVAEEERARMIVLGASGGRGSRGRGPRIGVAGRRAPRANTGHRGATRDGSRGGGAEAPALSSPLSRVLAQLSGTREWTPSPATSCPRHDADASSPRSSTTRTCSNRADTSTLEQLFDRNDVVDALGLTPVADLRNRIASAGGSEAGREAPSSADRRSRAAAGRRSGCRGRSTPRAAARP